MLSKRFRLTAKDRRGRDIAFYISMPDNKSVNITIGQGTDQIDIYISGASLLKALYELRYGKPYEPKHAKVEHHGEA